MFFACAQVDPLLHSNIRLAIGIIGLILDIIGALLIATPDFASPNSLVFSKGYSEYKKKRDNLHEEKNMLFTNGHINTHDEETEESSLARILKNELNAAGTVIRINRREGRGGGTQLQFRDRSNSEPLPDVTVENTIDQYLDEIKTSQDKKIRFYGFLFLALGICLQAISLIGSYRP